MWRDREIKCAQLSEEWFQARHGSVTGSVASDIMPGARGSYPAAREKLLYRKAIEHMCGVDESPDIPAKYSDWGHQYEPEAAKVYELETGNKLEEVGIIQSDFSKFAKSSVDRMMTNENGCVEIKCPFYLNNHLKHINKSPVEKLRSDNKVYYWQVRMHMLCTGADFCDWVSFHPDFEPKYLHVVRIERDEDEMDRLKEECLKFEMEMKQICKEVYE